MLCANNRCTRDQLIFYLPSYRDLPSIVYYANKGPTNELAVLLHANCRTLRIARTFV